MGLGGDELVDSGVCWLRPSQGVLCLQWWRSGCVWEGFQVQVCVNAQLWMPSSVWWLKTALSLCPTWMRPPWVIRPHPPMLLYGSWSPQVSVCTSAAFFHPRSKITTFLRHSFSLHFALPGSLSICLFFISYRWSPETFLFVIYNCLTSQAWYTLHDIALAFPGY